MVVAYLLVAERQTACEVTSETKNQTKEAIYWTMWKLLLIGLASFASCDDILTVEAQNNPVRSFVVDYKEDQFLLDGKPFQYVSGSFHYFRTPRAFWRDRLRKLRAAGLNAVSTYVEWSLHEPEPGIWRWSGEADLEHFLTLAQEEDLVVLLRPGPYICGERDLGGFPFWLLNISPDIRLRTNDINYMNRVAMYMNNLFPRIEPFLWGNGGPIIMVQIENEYGSFAACDRNYKTHLYNLMHRRVQDKALLYTTDGNQYNMLRCGTIPGAFGTVDFGVSVNVTKAFATLRQFQAKGPLVNSEFYPGWLTHWGERFQSVQTRLVTKTLDDMLAMGASVNFYMFYGGTNFGFTSGANSPFSPQLTSYDYDAPLTEAGDPTEKYFAIRDVIAKYLPMPNMSLPVPSPKGDYGLVTMEPVLKLFHTTAKTLFGINRVVQNILPTFESFGVPIALALYETNLPRKVNSDPNILRIGWIHDRALVYVDGSLAGTLSRSKNINNIVIQNPYARRLTILVENQGHINYGSEIHDFKGIKNVSFNDHALSNWNITGFRLDDITPLPDFPITTRDEVLIDSPVFLRGKFVVSGESLDTFLDTTGWGKGIAYVNGHNIGRYWPANGPQMTLYVPRTFLRAGENELVVLELEYLPVTRNLKFQVTPNMSGKNS